MRHGGFMLVATFAAIVALAGCGGSGTSTAAKVIVIHGPGGWIYRIRSGSMEPTFTLGSRVLVMPIASVPRLGLGSVVLVHPPEGAEQQLCGPQPHIVKPGGAACAAPIPHEDASTTLIKRIVAGPGDQIYISNGRAFVKRALPADFPATPFYAEPIPHSKPCGTSPGCDFPTPITIPAGHWFLLGDNRNESDDSRYWGPVPIGWIVGEPTPCTTTSYTCPR